MNPLTQLDHRPWPLPNGRWAMTQTWHDLLFAHWPVPPDALRPAVPPGLEIDTYNGAAWIGIIVFRLSGIRLNGLPEVPLVSHFPEINVRTYVTHGDGPGVYFLSLDADNRLAIALARPWFRLAYHFAHISLAECGDGICFRSRRAERHGPTADFAATYGPCSPAFRARPGSLEHWLTERYCYYSASSHLAPPRVGAGPRARPLSLPPHYPDTERGQTHRSAPTPSGRVYRCDIHHGPWQLQKAQARISENTMALSHGIQLPETEPSLLYARCMKALIWGVKRDIGLVRRLGSGTHQPLSS